MRILVLNQVDIPFEASEMIINSTDEILHLYIGSFIEGLNSKHNKTTTEEEKNGKN